VLWVRAASSIDLDRLGMRALEAPGALHVAIANPDYAPYGRAAVAAMQSARVYDSVRAKLVYGENISQTLQFVQSGAADIGIVSMSLALSPEVAKAGRFWQIPVNSYPRIEQAGTILQWAANPSAAALLRAFILSDAGRRVLERHGFSFPAS
jgi:molybdate transport system substrate-binding protein